MKNFLRLKTTDNPSHLSIEVILFFSLYVIAPSYLAVEFHQKLPLLTLSRLLLVAMGIMLAFRKRACLCRLQKPNLRALNLGLTQVGLLRLGLLGYFFLLFISDLALLPADKGESIKAISTLVLEEYFVVWLLSHILDTRNKLLIAM